MRESPAGDFDYEAGGSSYARYRRADPRIAAQLHAALGKARSVLNVGAGAGSYEPRDREVTAVEPSAAMRAQRPRGLPPAVDATAEDLPFPDDSFDAAMAIVTVHQWPDADAGLREMRRVSRGPVVILTFDGEAIERFWLGEYFPQILAAESRRYPRIDHIVDVLGGRACVSEVVAVPIDCTDGFTEAYYARPEMFLDPEARAAQSVWQFASEAETADGLSQLAKDLKSGRWDQRHGRLRAVPEYRGAIRLVSCF